jgi:hypothetical protein
LSGAELSTKNHGGEQKRRRQKNGLIPINGLIPQFFSLVVARTLIWPEGIEPFRWHKHDAFAQWAASEPVPLVKVDGSIVDAREIASLWLP